SRQARDGQAAAYVRGQPQEAVPPQRGLVRRGRRRRQEQPGADHRALEQVDGPVVAARARRRATVGLLVLPAVAFLLVFYAFPLFRLLLVRVEAPRWTLGHYVTFFTEPAYLKILTRTFRVRLTVTLGRPLLGSPTAI